MKIILSGIISGIKNIVIMIVAGEFLKAFMLEDSFKKYITVCINIIVIGFILGEIRNIPFAPEMNFEISKYEYEANGNAIKEEYEKRVAEALREKLKEEKISVYDVEIISNDDYSIKKVVLNINEKKETAEKIIKGMKVENYEIHVDVQ